MYLPVIIFALASTAFAETQRRAERPARSPQGQIEYSDPNGLKVNWKFYQWRSQPGNSQRAQRAETGTAQAQSPLYQPQQPQQRQQQQYQQQQQQRYQHQQQQYQQQQQQHAPTVIDNQQYYKPYAAVPQQIKELIVQTYQPQRPYVDPSSFLYQGNAIPGHEEQQSTARAEGPLRYDQSNPKYQQLEQAETTDARDYHESRATRTQGGIRYKEDYEEQQQTRHQLEQQQQQQVHQISVPIETLPAQPLPKLFIDKNMPTEIQELLRYQAHIPYDVIANRILYKPKSPFIPKPLSDDVKGPYYYKSKVYYMKNDQIEEEAPSQFEENQQRH